MVADPEAVTVAAVQMTSGCDLKENLAQAEALLSEAAAAGARLAVLPENFAFMGKTDAERLAIAEEAGRGPVQSWLARCARAHALWLVAGTLPVRAGEGSCYSSCFVFDSDGNPRARYDKIHMFDVAIPGRADKYRESANTLPGQQTVVCDSPLGGLGLAVCYDLRFPEQFRSMLADGMQAIAIPAAFTRPTGAAHWRLLVRARAVENLCPVIAAAQCGHHESGRETWGHSMIVDAWGEVLAECEELPGIALARLNMQAASDIRTTFPALSHRRL